MYLDIDSYTHLMYSKAAVKLNRYAKICMFAYCVSVTTLHSTIILINFLIQFYLFKHDPTAYKILYLQFVSLLSVLHILFRFYLAS